MPNPLSDLLNSAAPQLAGDDSSGQQPAAPTQAAVPAPVAKPAPAPKPAVKPAEAAKTDDAKNIQMPSGHVISTPSDWPDDLVNKVASTFHAVQKYTGDAVGALASSFGLPGSIEEVKAANKMLPGQIEHPVQSLKNVAKSIYNLPAQTAQGQGALLDKAQKAWKSGDTGSAVQHFINYLVPLVGQVADQSGDELKSGDYGKAVGHTAAAVLPMLLGKPGSPVEAEEVAKPVVKAARPLPETVAKPMSDAERSAAAFLRQHRLEAPDVEQV